MTLARLSFLVHTSNRPLFVQRMLDELARDISTDPPKIVLMEASDDSRFAELEAILATRTYPFVISICRSQRELPLQHRFAQALEHVTTPYVALTADDDFYQLNAVRVAIAELDREPSLGTVYGHTAIFNLESYVPYAPFEGAYIHARSNPPLRWLESDDPVERIGTLNDTPNEASAIGWYAVQRTELLRTTTQMALDAGVGNYLLENLQIFVQSALANSRMIDAVLLARQENPKQNHTPPANDAIADQFAALEQSCATLLRQRGVDSRVAARIAIEFFDGLRLFADCSVAQQKREQLIRSVPGLAWLRRRFGGGAPQIGARGQAYPDPRLPPIPAIDEDALLLTSIMNACRPPAA